MPNRDVLIYETELGYRIPALNLIPGPQVYGVLPKDGPYHKMYNYWWLVVIDKAMVMYLYQATDSSGQPIPLADESLLVGATWVERLSLNISDIDATSVSTLSVAFSPTGRIMLAFGNRGSNEAYVARHDETIDRLVSYATFVGKDVHLLSSYTWRRTSAGADIVVAGLDSNRTLLLSYVLPESYMAHIYGPIIPGDTYRYLPEEGRWMATEEYDQAMCILGVRYSHTGAYLIMVPASWTANPNDIKLVPIRESVSEVDDKYWLGTSILDAYGVYVAIMEG